MGSSWSLGAMAPLILSVISGGAPLILLLICGEGSSGSVTV